MSEDPKHPVQITVAPDGPALAERAAALFIEQARAAVADHGRFSVALSGGHTPEPTYRRLAQAEVGGQVPWEHVHVFWGDERCVPPDDSRSNERMARHTLLDDVAVPPSQVHPIRCAGDPPAAARDYENTLRTHFGEAPRFDLVLLGLGTDGHTASLFPGTDVLRERSRWAAAVKPGRDQLVRVTLTLPVLQQASCVAFLVAGDAKAAMVHRVLQSGDADDGVPASHVRPAGPTHWLLDSAAASQLDDV